MSKMEMDLPERDTLHTLQEKVSKHIQSARNNIVKSIDSEMLKAYWFSGRDIVLEEQSGGKRADYGKFIMRRLSERLQKEFGKGFSESTLVQMRKFYVIYQADTACEKPYTLCTESGLPRFAQNLGWSHYRILMRIENRQARTFYEAEASKNAWSSRFLKRQIDTLLFERLAMSKDKKGLLQLAAQGQVIEKPQDIIKSPLILEFIDLPQTEKMKESDLESAIITHIQRFLLELGRGFAFVGRQKTIVLNERRYAVDLVFYHFILKCYVLADIKIGEVTHGDIGQMQFYVNYYDRKCKAQDDNPTVGLLLCASKDDEMVEYTLGDNNKQIFASKYQFQLPTTEELEAELKKERRLIEATLNKR